jgi:prepilin-type N-terminal cleavage/methylation domain-containing protein
MKLTTTHRRTGFTLLELLVVIGVMLVLATLALFLAPRFQDDQRTTRGADLVTGWLLIQKQRAHRDQVPRGVRLVRDPNNPNFINSIMYIEQPEDWSNPTTTVQVPSPAPIPPPVANAGEYRTAWIANKDLAGEGVVQVGDFLVLDAESTPLNAHRIASASLVTLPGGQVGTHLIFGSAEGTSLRGVPGVHQSSGFRIVRQPRAMVGEQPLLFPRDVIVDLAGNFGYPALTTDAGMTVLPGAQLDIVFNQRGQVLGANSIGGKIILRLRNGDRASNDGDQLLITIHTRTGLITTHPVNVDPPFGNPMHDPYLFVRDGKSSGM